MQRSEQQAMDNSSTRAQATPHHHGNDIIREKTTREHEIIREGHDSHHDGQDHIHHSFEMDNTPAAAPGIIITETVPAGPGATTTTTFTKINPRTGKPISMPTPLSLQPRDPSPIQTPMDAAQGGHLIREEHEEVSISD
jgi:hypothetical protein